MKESLENRINGIRFEQELCEILAKNGFWAHNMAQREEGQPADIIAVKNNVAVLIDCKVCENDKFSLERIEPNQESAMTLWKNCGNLFYGFAVKLSNGDIHMLYPEAFECMNKKVLNKTDIREFDTFEDFLISVNSYIKGD